MKCAFLVLSFSLSFAGICGCGGAPPPKPEEVASEPLAKRSPENCDHFKTQMDAVWNGDVLETLDLTVRIYKGELDASDGERIVSELNSLSERWVALRTEACQMHNNAPTSDNDDRLSKCLDEKLRDLERKLGLFADGDLSVLDGIRIILDECRS